MRTLNAISAQTSTDFEVILVDNNSSDNSASMMSEWAQNRKFKVVILQEHQAGAAAARQCGLEHVVTPWTLFFDSDDTMAPNHIARVVEAIKSQPEADLIGWDIRFHNLGGTTDIKPFSVNDTQFHSLFHGSTGTQRYCATTTLFNKAGGWNKALSIWDDIELGARLIALNPSIIKLKGEPTVDVYLGADSITMGTHAANIDELNKALNSIASILGNEKAHWINLKRIILAAKSKAPDGPALYRKTLSEAKSHRTALRIAYYYTRLGGRGIARLLRPFI